MMGDAPVGPQCSSTDTPKELEDAAPSSGGHKNAFGPCRGNKWWHKDPLVFGTQQEKSHTSEFDI